MYNLFRLAQCSVISMPANRFTAFASLALGYLLFAGACVDLTRPKGLASGAGGQGGTSTTSSGTAPGKGGAGGTTAIGAGGTTAIGAGGTTAIGAGGTTAIGAGGTTTGGAGATTGGASGATAVGAGGTTAGGAGGTTAGGTGGVATGGAGGVSTGGTATGGKTATGGSTSPGDGGVPPDLRTANEVTAPVEVAPPPDAKKDAPTVLDVAPDVTPDVARVPDVTPDVAQIPDVTPDVAPDVTPDDVQVPDLPPDTTTVVPGLLLYYSFDEVTGTTVPDKSGNGNDGTLVAPFSIAAGKLGNALVLTGTATSGGYVVMPPAILATSSEMTIATWFRINSTNAPYQRVFDIGSSPTISSMFLTPTYGPGGPLHFTIRFTLSDGGVTRDDIDGTAIAAAQWYHTAVVIDASGNGRLYLDGAQVGTTTPMKFRPSSLGSTPNDWIGRSEFANPYFDGAIDEFRIYSRALSAAEISALRDYTGH
jgi:hypothetical protein